ncbi:MAG: response regulator transcription factor [Candidatus Rokubacteria bacterium]|nr:response regulator transcription factor [Candidatus Rokubacteria bacterium]
MNRKSPAVITTPHAKDRGARPEPYPRNPVRVCIVYEHALFAHGIKGLLEQQKTLRMVGMIERAHLALRELKRLKPDVVVVEGDGGMTILESLEGVMGVAVNLRGDDATIFTGLPIRVSGPEELADAIRAIAGKGGRGRKVPA